MTNYELTRDYLAHQLQAAVGMQAAAATSAATAEDAACRAEAALRTAPESLRPLFVRLRDQSRAALDLAIARADQAAAEAEAAQARLAAHLKTNPSTSPSP